MQESQQAPGGLVGDRGVEREHQERVEPQEAQDPRVRSGDSPGAPAGRAPDDRQHEDEALGPQRRPLGGEVDQQAQVVIPGVEVPGGGAGPIQVDPVGPHRVHDAPGVAQERREEQGRHEDRREERQQQVPASHEARDRGRGLPAPAVGEPGQGERQEHGAQRQGRRLLRRVHQARAGARQKGRRGAGFAQVAAGREQGAEAEEDERGLVDVVPAVEDHGRGDRDEQGRDRGAGRAQEGPRAEVGGDERHAQRGGDDAQGALVDRDVPPRALEPGGGQGQVVEGGPVVLRRIVGVPPALEQRPELVRVHGLVAVHRTLGEARKAQGRGQQDRGEKDPSRAKRDRDRLHPRQGSRTAGCRQQPAAPVHPSAPTTAAKSSARGARIVSGTPLTG